MTNAITVRAVMAFSLLVMARTAFADEDKPVMEKFGAVEPCTHEAWGALPARIDPGTKLLAAYGYVNLRTSWVLLLQRNERFIVESTQPPARRREVDPLLARTIAARMATDIAQDAFTLEREQTNEVMVDMPWSIFSADGTTCAMMNLMDRSRTGGLWSRVFEQLAGEDPARSTLTWFWLDQLGKVPTTLPTRIASVTPEHDVIGAGSAWKHTGTNPLAILEHGVRILDGDLVILGEVINRMAVPREGVRVIATFFDTNGKERATEDEDIAFDLLPAGARSPFEIEVPAGEFASYTLHIDAGADTQLRPPTIGVTESHAQVDDDRLVINGTVRNDGQTDEDFIGVVVSLYDGSGRLLDCDSADVRDWLQRGASAPFKVSFDRPRGYHHFGVQINPDYRDRHFE